MATFPSRLEGLRRSDAVQRERLSLLTHRQAFRGESIPPPQSAPQRTFLHGFLLPFSLLATTLHHRALRFEYLRLGALRLLVVAVIAGVAFGSPSIREHLKEPRLAIVGDKGADEAKGKHAPKAPHGRSFTLSLDDDGPAQPKTPDAADENDEDDDAAKAAASVKDVPRPVRLLQASWLWIVWVVGVLSMIEAFVVLVSRRWDDWLGYWTAPLVHVRSEDTFPPQRKLTLFDARWLVKKLKRRLRGYVVVFSGIPLIALFQLVPTFGHVLFTVAMTMWTWYWLAIFTTAKSAHAWRDDGYADAPVLIRELRDRAVDHGWLWPVRRYARLWSWLTRGLHAPAAVFERNPRPFLGLALARALLSLPGIYLLSRPVIPVAAGRLCAESDPYDRFSC